MGESLEVLHLNNEPFRTQKSKLIPNNRNVPVVDLYGGWKKLLVTVLISIPKLEWANSKIRLIECRREWALFAVILVLPALIDQFSELSKSEKVLCTTAGFRHEGVHKFPTSMCKFFFNIL